MFTVALIGADGAGKTTVSRRLEKALPLPVKYIYMGVNLGSSNHMLPTTRLLRLLRHARGGKSDVGGPPDPNRIRTHPKGARYITSNVKSSLHLANRIAEEWFRQILTWYYQWHGYIVIFDRHFFFDYYAYDIAHAAGELSLGRRVHGFMLKRVYPKPDLVILLDAPPEVLFARKHEGTLELLESRRQEYLQLRQVLKYFSIVDASQKEDEVVRQVIKVISDFYQFRTGRTTQFQQTAAPTTDEN
jgi:thymidylate kinase